jgi:hypothetical protein
MINDIKEYYRYRLYENCRVLVNNLKEPIDELCMFLDKKVYPFIKDNDLRIVVEGIEILYENEKFVWRIIEDNELNNINTKRLDSYNVVETFKGKDEYLQEIKETLVSFPKELYGLSFISFMETISHFIFNEEKINDIINVFGICMLSSNATNNVVYEVQ